MPKLYKTIVDAVKEITQKGIAKVIMETEPKLLVKGRSSKEPLPEKFKGLKKVTFGTYPIGYDYFTQTTGVGGQLTASGSSPNNFTVQKAKGMHIDPTIPNGIVYESDKNPSQKYIRIYKKTGKLLAKTDSVYVNENKEIVTVSKEEYAEYFPVSSPPKKQIEAGMNEDRTVEPMSPKAENIKYLKKGDIIFGNEAELKRILDLLEKLDK